MARKLSHHSRVLASTRACAWQWETGTHPCHEQPEREPELFVIVDAETRVRGGPETAGAVGLREAVEEDDPDDGDEREDTEDGRVREYRQREQDNGYKPGPRGQLIPKASEEGDVHCESKEFIGIRRVGGYHCV